MSRIMVAGYIFPRPENLPRKSMAKSSQSFQSAKRGGFDQVLFSKISTRGTLELMVLKRADFYFASRGSRGFQKKTSHPLPAL